MRVNFKEFSARLWRDGAKLAASMPGQNIGKSGGMKAGQLSGTMAVQGSPVTGKQNIVIGSAMRDSMVYTVFQGDNDAWMRWQHDNHKTEFKLSNDWFRINPESLRNKHPLDLGSIIDTKDKEDLDEIRQQYENHVKSSPWLQKLRRDYDKLLEKHELFDTIKGDADA